MMFSSIKHIWLFVFNFSVAVKPQFKLFTSIS